MGEMGLAEIFDRAVEIVKRNIKTIVLYALSYGVIAFIAAIIVLIVGSIAGVIMTIPLAMMGMIFPFVFIGILMLMIYSFAASYQIGIINIASQEFLDTKVMAHNALGSAFKSIFKVFALLLCGTVLFIPFGGVLGAIIYFIYKIFEGPIGYFVSFGGADIVLILSLLALMLAIIGVFVGYFTWYVFALHAIAIEGLGPIAAIKRSFKLVRHNYWRIFFLLILTSLTVTAITSSAYSFLLLLVNIVYGALRFINIAPDYLTFLTSGIYLVRWPLNILTMFVISPIGTIAISLLYFNQRFKKEGFDISLELMRLQKNNERKQASEAVENMDSTQA